VTSGDQTEDLRLGVQTGDRQIHWHPEAVFLVAEPESFLGMKDAGATERQPHSLQTIVEIRTNELGDFHFQQLAAAETAEPLGHRVDSAELFRFGIEQEQSIAGFFEEGAAEFLPEGFGHRSCKCRMAVANQQYLMESE